MQRICEDRFAKLGLVKAGLPIVRKILPPSNTYDHGAVAITVRQELVTQEHAFLAKLCHDRLQFLVALCNLLGSGFKFLHPFLLLLSAFGGCR